MNHRIGWAWLIAWATLAQSPAWAASPHEPGEHQHGSHPECPLPKNPNDVLECVRSRHPDSIRARLAVEQASELPRAASQWLNPEFQASSVLGSSLGDQLAETNLSLQFPIEVGGKRGARKSIAESQKLQAEADQTETLSRVVRETVSNLYRAAQLSAERKAVEEAIVSFERLAAQYRRRIRLSPEQEVSLSLFGMAESEYRLKLASLMEEERAIEHFFHVNTGHGLEELKPAYPDRSKEWPDLPDQAATELNSPARIRGLADLRLANAEFDSAAAGAWPDLQIGPSARFVQEGGIRFQQYGLGVTLPLPLFSLNGGERAVAARGRIRAETSLDLTRSLDQHERHEQLHVYRDAVEALKKAPSLSKLEREHQRVETLAMQGLLPSALVIEAHRQIVDLQGALHERELRAAQTLWTVYEIEGRTLKERL